MPTYTDRLTSFAIDKFRLTNFIFKTAIPLKETELRPTTGQLYPRGRK